MKLRTSLCDLLSIEVPIIQAGMGWDKEGMTTQPELVAAVSNAGGLVCIGGSSIRPEVIRERIRAVRKLTDRPFGVDITLPKMEEVKIPDPDEVRKEIEEKYPKHAKFTDELIPKLGWTVRAPISCSGGHRPRVTTRLDRPPPTCAVERHVRRGFDAAHRRRAPRRHNATQKRAKA